MCSIGKYLTMLRNDPAVTQNSHLCEQNKLKIYHSRLTCQPIIIHYYRRVVWVRNVGEFRVTHSGNPLLRGAVGGNQSSNGPIKWEV